MITRILIVVALAAAGCAAHPSRNMDDMTADQMRAELARPIMGKQPSE